jgi:multidrug efflux system outer membrane protein
MIRLPFVVRAFGVPLLASTMVAGCVKVGPDYVRPEVPTPPQYRFVDGPAQAETLADVGWWLVFQDPTLQALIREAIANNLDLRAAVARVERTRALAGISKSFLYPQVEGVVDYGVLFNEDEDGDDVRQNGLYGFRLSWELDLFGRIKREHESALAITLSTEQARRGVMVTLVGDVASNYFLLRELDLAMAIARETLRVNDETVTYFRNRLDGGVSNRLEVDRIVANRSVTATSIPDLEQRIAIVEHALSFLLGRVPGPIERPAVRDDQQPPPPIPAGLPASLLERRPDVLQAEQLLVAANADVGAAKALFFPRIGLTGLIGGVSGSLVTTLGTGGLAAQVGAGLVQPLFNGRRLRSNYEAAQAAVDEAVAQYQNAALNGYREVANSLVTIQKLAEMRVEIEVGVLALENAAGLSRSRYDTGLASYLEILTTDERLFGEQLRLAQTRGAELRARAELYRALGGGWQPQPQP